MGESNPYSDEAMLDLLPWPRGAAGDRVRRLLGMTDREYLGAFDRVNLVRLVRRRGPWDAATAAVAAMRLRDRAVGRDFVLLGARVCLAFGVPYEPFTRPGPRLWVLPHPSGRCRAWNDRAAAGRARRLLEPLLQGLEKPPDESVRSPLAPPGVSSPTKCPCGCGADVQPGRRGRPARCATPACRRRLWDLRHPRVETGAPPADAGGSARERVRALLSGRSWLTLRELAALADVSDPGRTVRKLREPDRGGYLVEHRVRAGAEREYRMARPLTAFADRRRIGP